MILKKRKAKNSKRGLYLQDKQLNETVFKPGTHFKYVIDNNKKEILIVPTDEKGNTVSKRTVKDTVKSVIDIRNRAALSIFSGMDKLEVEIFEDKVLVRGYKNEPKETESNSFISKAKSVAEKVVNKVAKVVNLEERIEAKKKIEVLFSKEQLEKVAGDTFQLNLFDTLESQDSRLSRFTGTPVQTAINNAKIPLELTSLFSGAGLMDLGFKAAGFDLKFALEMDRDAANTYWYNLGKHIVLSDIMEYELAKIRKSPVMAMGNPCTVFSNANRSTKRLLEHPDYKLIKRTIDAIKKNNNCKVFIWENVPQILTALDGDVLAEIKDELNDFEITHDVLCAADYGSPQLRKRAIIIGSKIGKIDLPKPTVKPENYMTVREAFQGLSDLVPNQLDFTKPKKDTTERMKFIPEGGNWKSLPEELKTKKMKEGSTHSSIYRRLEWDKPSISLPNFRKSNIMPPEGNRSLTVREAARLFGLPNNFVFKGKLNSMQQQVCNGVAFHMAKAVALTVKNAIQQFNIRNGFEKLSLV